jgi:CRP-like cAMP-binding protein
MFKAPATPIPAHNQLLGALPANERERLFPNLQRITLSVGQVLYAPGERMNNVYFPTNSAVSLLYTTQNGSTAEMGLVGCDGVVGIAPVLGGETSYNRALVLIAGDAFKISAKQLQKEFARGGPLQRVLLLYIEALIAQVSQTAVCNRLHSVEQRLCRWLLLCQDRASSVELFMTQEHIANMLGGRRESVTVSAGRLQDAGLIHYCRGHIKVLDRRKLEAAACECYQVVEDERDRLFDRLRASALGSCEVRLKEAG